MGLIDNEGLAAEKYIQKLEKDSHRWKWLRWTGLLGSILIFAFTAYSYYRLAEIQDKLHEITSSILLYSDKLDASSVQLYVEGQLTYLRLELLLFFQIALQLIVGTSLLAWSLTNWNRHITSRLLAKALRKLTSEEEKIKQSPSSDSAFNQTHNN